MTLFLIILALLGAGIAFWTLRKRARHAGLLATRLSSEDWEMILDEVPLLARMPAELRPALEGKIALFLDQVEFIGCDGFELDRGVELAIAAQACLVVVGSDAWYETLRTVLIYPGAFKSVQRHYDGYVMREEEIVRTGESWARGPVVLSWMHSERGAQNDRDGQNVVIHEFAHQLDNLSGDTDGVPVLGRGHSLESWAEIWIEAYKRHIYAVERGKRTVIDPYGAEGHEEFFAVALELFFERPEDLRGAEPEVYAQLATLLRLDPISWGKGA